MRSRPLDAVFFSTYICKAPQIRFPSLRTLRTPCGSLHLFLTSACFQELRCRGNYRISSHSAEISSTFIALESKAGEKETQVSLYFVHLLFCLIFHHPGTFVTVIEHIILESGSLGKWDPAEFMTCLVLGLTVHLLSIFRCLFSTFLCIPQVWDSLFRFHPFIVSHYLTSHPNLQRFQNVKSHRKLWLEFHYVNGGLLGVRPQSRKWWGHCCPRYSSGTRERLGHHTGIQPKAPGQEQARSRAAHNGPRLEAGQLSISGRADKRTVTRTAVQRNRSRNTTLREKSHLVCDSVDMRFLGRQICRQTAGVAARAGWEKGLGNLGRQKRFQMHCGNGWRTL